MTNIEKMVWLHAQGFVPDKWYTGGNYFSPKKEVHIDWDDDTGVVKFEHPYFSETALWRLLPDYLYLKASMHKSQGDYDKYIVDDCVGYAQKDYYGAIEFYKAFEVEENLHSAILNCVVWAVKEGYIKGIKV